MAKRVSSFGVTKSLFKQRLDAIKDPENQKKDAEHIMARLWDEENTRDSGVNWGVVPLDLILHECGPKCDPAKGKHDYSRYSKHSEADVKIAAATVQWLASNCGRSFLHEFDKVLKEANKSKPVSRELSSVQ